MNPESFLANSIDQKSRVGRVIRDSIMNKVRSPRLVEWAVLPGDAEIVGGSNLEVFQLDRDVTSHKLTRRRAVTLLGAGAIAPLRGLKASTSSVFSTDKKTHDGLYYASLQEVGRRIQSHELSPVDLTRMMLDRIAKVDLRLKSYATVMSEQALADASAALQEIQAGRYRGPVHGVPIAIKDLCYTQGFRTMGGTAVLKNFVPAFDSTVVAKLRTAGAVVLGKLNLSEGAAAGYNPSFDVPLNPWRAD